MRFIFLVLVDIMLVALFLYARLLPHKDKLDAKHKRYFDMADKLFGWVLKSMEGSLKPYKVGEDLAINISQVALFALLLALHFVIGFTTK